MELRHLKYFLKLAEELSFVRAAEKLFISQPPLSRQIKELEVELGVKLFDRNNKRVQLTAAGKYYEKEIRELVCNLEQINLKAQKIGQNKNGEFRIAYVSSTFSGDIAKLIQYLSAAYPYVNFRLYEVPTIKQIEAIEEGKIHLGIVRAPILSAKITTKLWFKDSFSLVFNAQLIKITAEEDLESLKNETFVFFNKEYAPRYYDNLLEICARLGFEPKVVHESNNISSIIQLVKNGLGISIVPTNVVKNYENSELGFVELKQSNLFTAILIATPKNRNSQIADAATAFLLK